MKLTPPDFSIRYLLIFALGSLALGPSCICERTEIERPAKQTLEQKVKAALAAGGFGWVTSKVLGSDVTLEGVAKSPGMVQKALAAVKGIEGVGKIINKMTVPRNYDISFNRKGDTIVLEGAVPSAKVKAEFGAAAQKIAKVVNNKLTIQAGTADTGFSMIGQKMAQGLGFIKGGHIDLTKHKINVSGAVSAEDKAKLEGLFKGLPGGYSLSGMSLLDAGAVEKCDTDFSALLSKTQIRFRSGKADIDPRSKSLLKKLTDIAKACPGRIAVEGHTDSTGDAEANQKLSEARANAVKAAFVKGGVAEAQVSAIGFGQMRPIGDNATKEGQAKNRRIEMHVAF